jgi:hypothetical protein
MRLDGQCDGKYSQSINLLCSLLTLMKSVVRLCLMPQLHESIKLNKIENFGPAIRPMRRERELCTTQELKNPWDVACWGA